MSGYPEDDASIYHGGAPASLVGGPSEQQFYNQGQSQSQAGGMGWGIVQVGQGQRVLAIRWTLLD
jgi:hypothetical protein